MSPRSLLPLAIGLLVAWAACIGPADSTRPADAPNPNQPVVGIDEGAIQGRVLDDALIPIEGALVVLDQAVEAVSDESGLFAFSLVPPGPHSIRATREGFGEAWLEVTVTAGAVAQATFQLVPFASHVAYYETSTRVGEISCSIGFRVFAVQNGAPNRANPCGVFSIVGVAEDLNQEWLTHNVGTRTDGKVGFWGETEWQPNQPLGQELLVNWGVQSDGVGGRNGWPLVQVEGRSPLAARIPIDVVMPYWEGNVNGTTTGECPPQGPCELYSLHYPRANVTGSSTLDAAPYVQQRYTDYLTTFFFGTLPERFSVLPDN